MSQSLTSLLTDIRACRLCEPVLPLGPRPIVHIHSTQATLLIVGQAPGTKVHESGIPWNDPSGERLRDWLQMDREQFYHDPRIAIVPMGFCYPGKGKSGDLPPRKECAAQWRPPLEAQLNTVKLTLLIGQYAQQYYLPKPKLSLTERVRRFEEFLPHYFPLPHPSPRNLLWLKRNPWFEKDCLPALRARLQTCWA